MQFNSKIRVTFYNAISSELLQKIFGIISSKEVSIKRYQRGCFCCYNRNIMNTEIRILQSKQNVLLFLFIWHSPTIIERFQQFVKQHGGVGTIER